MERTQQRPRRSLFEAGTAARPTLAASTWAIAVIVVITAIGLLIRLGEVRPLAIDHWWNGVAEVTRGSGPYAVAVGLADIGGVAGMATCAAIAAAALFALRRPRDATSVIVAVLLGALSNEVLKIVALRSRPADPLHTSSGLSFPSGHSMGAAALAISLALVVAGTDAAGREVVRWVAIAAVGWTLLMMWSRTALHVHWITDTLAGALVGASVAVIARRLCLRDAPPPR